MSHGTAWRGTKGLWRGGGHGRGTWGEEGSPADVPDGVDPSPGGVLVLVHHHMALGVHLHALPWETAAASARAPGGTGQAMPMGDPCWWPAYSHLGAGHGGNTILWQALAIHGTPGELWASLHQHGRDVQPSHHSVQAQVLGVGLPPHGPKQAVHVPDHSLRRLAARHQRGHRHIQ